MKRLKYYLKFTNPLAQWLNRIRKDESCYITCSGKSDGGGAQVQSVMSTMAFAHTVGVKYVHTPFSQIEHNDDCDDDWVSAWENYFNLADGEIQVGMLDSSEIRVIQLRKATHFKRKKNTLYVVPHSHDYCDVVPSVYEEVHNSLLQKYQQSQVEKPRLDYKEGELNIAIHVRRGDVSVDENAKRYTGNQMIIDRLNCVLGVMAASPQKRSVHVYSQGEQSDFQELLDMGAELHLNTDVFSVFHHLCSADVLMMSKSSLSYCAALLSEGVVIYEPFWHCPMSDWIVVKPGPSMDDRFLKRMLVSKLGLLAEEET